MIPVLQLYYTELQIGDLMAGSVVQVRIDEKLKKEVSKVYENLGLDLSSAVRMFF